MPVLTDSEYEQLRPYRDIITFFNQTGQIVNTAGHQTIYAIFRRINPEEQITGCRGCMDRVYHLMNEYIKEYENG